MNDKQKGWHGREGGFKNVQIRVELCFLAGMCLTACLSASCLPATDSACAVSIHRLHIRDLCVLQCVHSNKNRTVCGFAGIAESPQSLLCCWEYKYKYQYVSEEASTESVHNRCLGKLFPENHSISI